MSGGLVPNCVELPKNAVLIDNLTIQYEWSEDHWWVAEIVEVSGALSQGRTKEEARVNVLDALNELMEARRADAVKNATEPGNIETIPMAS
jgi:predicted RNase H-like HicB family nuclease